MQNDKSSANVDVLDVSSRPGDAYCRRSSRSDNKSAIRTPTLGPVAFSSGQPDPRLLRTRISSRKPPSAPSLSGYQAGDLMQCCVARADEKRGALALGRFSASATILAPSFNHGDFVESGRPFGRCENATAGQRPLARRCPDGARLFIRRHTIRASARPGQPDVASRLQPAHLGSSFATRYYSEVKTDFDCTDSIVAVRLRLESKLVDVCPSVLARRSNRYPKSAEIAVRDHRQRLGQSEFHRWEVNGFRANE